MNVIKVPDQVDRLYNLIQAEKETLLSADLVGADPVKEFLVRLVDDMAPYYAEFQRNPYGEVLHKLENFLSDSLSHIYIDRLSSSLIMTSHEPLIIDLFVCLLGQLKNPAPYLATDARPTDDVTAAASSTSLTGQFPVADALPDMESPVSEAPVAGKTEEIETPLNNEAALTETDLAVATADSPHDLPSVAPDSDQDQEVASPPVDPAPLAEPEPAPPRPDGPLITVRLKIVNSGGNDPRPFEILRNLIDSAPPIMGVTNEKFEYSLDLNVDKYFSVRSVDGSTELTETLGLEVGLADQRVTLKGTPKEGFDGRLNFAFTAGDHSRADRFHQKPMYIAADPRTLWQDLPVVDDQGYPAENVVWDGLELPLIGRTAVAASRRGRSHAHAAKPRDDCYALGFDPASGWHFAAVADGAGSAKFSRKGAAIACETAVGKLREYLTDAGVVLAVENYEGRLAEWKTQFETDDAAIDGEREKEYRSQIAFDKIMHRVVYDCYMAINDEAAAKGAQVRDYHTTLLCAAFRKFSFGYLMISYWVGDGAMCLYNWNGRGRALVPGAPDGGEFAGQTRFMTMMKEEINEEAVYRRTRYTFADDFEALIMMTDGLTDPFFPSEKDVATEKNWRTFWTEILPKGIDDNPGCPELFDGSLSPPEQGRALCQWLNFWSKGNHDDRTILIIK